MGWFGAGKHGKQGWPPKGGGKRAVQGGRGKGRQPKGRGKKCEAKSQTRFAGPGAKGCQPDVAKKRCEEGWQPFCSTTQAPSEIRSDPEELAPPQLEVKLYTLGGSEYTVWLDRDATMGQLVNKLRPQLPPRQQDVTNCAVVTSGTNPVPYPLRSPWVYRIMCTPPVTDMIASGAPIRFQLVWSATPVALIPSPQIQRFLRDKTDGSKHDAKKVGNPTWKGI